MAKIYLKPLLFTIFLVYNYQLFSQDSSFHLFEQKFDLSTGIANDQEDILIHRNKILTANIYGVDVYDGVTWVRNRLNSSSDQLQHVYRLHKDKDNHQRVFLVANNYLAEYKISLSGKYRFKKIIDLKEKNNIGYVLNVYEANQRVYFLGNKGLIIFNKQTSKVQKYPLPKLKKAFFLDHFIDHKLILNEVEGNTFLWSNNKKSWIKTSDYSFFSKHRVQFTQRLSNGDLLIITTQGEVFRKKRNQALVFENRLTKECKGGHSFEIKEKNDFLYLIMHNKLLIYDLKLQKITFKKLFDVRVSSLEISKVGDVWLSTVGRGVLFIESNSIFQVKDNNNQIYHQFHIGYEVLTITKNKTELALAIENKQVKRYSLGWIWNIKAIGNQIYISSSKGLFKKGLGKTIITKIYDEECFNIEYLSSKRLLALCNNKALILSQNDYTVVSKASIKGRLVQGIEYGNAVYISTENECFEVKLSAQNTFSGQVKSLIKSKKNEGLFKFTEFDKKLLIHNIENLYIYSPKEGLKLFYKQIVGFPYNKDKALVKFTNISKLGKDSLLVVPVLGGEHNGMNLPGLIIRTNNKYIWDNKAFRRLSKYEMDNLVKVSTNEFQIVTPVSIIKFDPLKKINVTYSFKAFIQKIQVKTPGVNTLQEIQNKGINIDSVIYFGNALPQTTSTLGYQHNTLTFTYASDSWAAYERNEYSYQLIGQDETWSKWSKEQKKEYTNLHEGTYTFQVRCRNVYGTISSVATYTFTILPPWYRTWWAYTLYILTAIGLLVGGSIGYSRFRNRQIRRRNQELEQVVEERTEEIRSQKEEITQQAEELKTTNEELIKANEQIQYERDEKIKVYMQEATDATSKLQEIRQTLAQKGAATADKMLSDEINTASEFVIIRDKVRNEFPDFAEKIDQALADKDITKFLWQVGHCIQLGMTPMDIADVLHTTNRSVSTQGNKLRKKGLLPPLKK